MRQEATGSLNLGPESGSDVVVQDGCVWGASDVVAQREEATTSSLKVEEGEKTTLVNVKRQRRSRSEGGWRGRGSDFLFNVKRQRRRRSRWGGV